MNRPDLIKRISEVLRDNDIKKKVAGHRQVFHISDDEGNTKDFRIKKPDRRLLYTNEDITAIIDACVYVIAETIKSGDTVNWRGLGKFALKYRKPRNALDLNGEPIEIPGKFVTKFTPSRELKMSANVYGTRVNDRLCSEALPIFDDSPNYGTKSSSPWGDDEVDNADPDDKNELELEVIDDDDEGGDDE